jgi:hypothetical protein
MKALEFLTEANVGNLDEIEGLMHQYAERVQADTAKRWFLTTVRNYIINTPEMHRAVETLPRLAPDWMRRAFAAGDLVQAEPTEAFIDHLDHIVDWLNGLAPADPLIVRIDRVSVPQAIEHADQWTRRLARAADRRPDAGEAGVERILQFEALSWVKVVSPQALDREGKLMQHCVGSYASAVANGRTTIYSLRDDKNDPHVTVEIKADGNVSQVKGKQNRPPVERYVPFVKVLLNAVPGLKADPNNRDLNGIKIYFNAQTGRFGDLSEIAGHLDTVEGVEIWGVPGKLYFAIVDQKRDFDVEIKKGTAGKTYISASRQIAFEKDSRRFGIGIAIINRACQDLIPSRIPFNLPDYLEQYADNHGWHFVQGRGFCSAAEAKQAARGIGHTEVSASRGDGYIDFWTADKDKAIARLETNGRTARLYEIGTWRRTADYVNAINQYLRENKLAIADQLFEPLPHGYVPWQNQFRLFDDVIEDGDAPAIIYMTDEDYDPDAREPDGRNRHRITNRWTEDCRGTLRELFVESDAGAPFIGQFDQTIKGLTEHGVYHFKGHPHGYDWDFMIVVAPPPREGRQLYRYSEPTTFDD